MDLTMRNELATVELAALTAATEKDIVIDESDEKVILVISHSSATPTDLTVKAGNGWMGTTDLVLTVAQGTHLLKLESARFKNVSGAKKGKITVVSTGTPKVGVVAIV